jgi:hypothetical protein
MPGQQDGRLRVNSESGWPVGDCIEFLAAIRRAYNSLVVLASILDSYNSYGYPTHSGGRARLGLFGDPLINQTFVELPFSEDFISSLMLPQEKLLIRRVQLSSPGFWEFVGLLNPLEVIRKFIDDCHQRRQDREYREQSERRRLEIQNDILETQMLRERIQTARELGIPDYQMTQLLNRLVYEPMGQVEVLIARGIILPADENSDNGEH